MKLEGVGEGASREDISENLSKFGEVKYVDFTRGDNGMTLWSIFAIEVD